MKNNFVSSQQIPVAMAIIHQEGKYLMQLRDDLQEILYPGVWGLFGGHLEPGEDPEAGLKRELIEEIGYRVEKLTEFRCYGDDRIMRYMYSCPLLVPIEELQLNEGQDSGLLTAKEIEEGFGYSHRLKEKRPLGDIHRQMMLDFITAQTSKNLM